MGGDRFLEPRGHKVEGLVPTGLDAVDDRRDCETRAVAAGEFLGEAEARRQIEPADAVRRADKAGHDSDVAGEALRHYLEHCAVTGAEHSHGRDDDRKRDPEIGEAAADDQEQHRDEAVDEAQRLDPADPVGDRAAGRARERAGEYAGGGGVAGVCRGEAMLAVEVDRQK